MVRNERMYEEAVRLRERGFTLTEIAKYCNVSKSTVSKWLKNNAMSAVVTQQNKKRAGTENAKRLRLMNAARGTERQKRYSEAAQTAKTEFKHYKSDPYFIAGLVAYAASGDLRDPNRIRLTTARSVVHRSFIKFATEYLGVPKAKVRFWLLLTEGQNEEKCMQHWKRVTTLPYPQFHQSQYVRTLSNKKVLHHGVGNTIIGSTVLKAKLTTWVQLLEKAL